MRTDQALENYAGILVFFKGLTWHSSGNGTALCPSHEDRHKSLSVKLGRDGQLMVKCHAKHGCTAESIAAAVGAKIGDFFPPSNGEKQQGRRITHDFDYVDVGGEILYRTVRTADKQFWQERPDPATGKWAKCLGDVKRIPYHLPELFEASPERTVLVAEGELKVHTLEGLGLLATCNAGGAENWPVWWGAEYFTGRHVAILPDQDEAGWKHAALVASTLAPHCRTLRVVELPGLRLKEDVVDWLNRFPECREEKRRSLFAVIEHAPLYDNTDNQLRLVTLRMQIARAVVASCLG